MNSKNKEFKLTRFFLSKGLTGLIIAAFFALAFLSIGSKAQNTSNESNITASPQAVFTNSTAITVTSGAANNGVPYPSAITVSGLSGTIPTTPGSVKVTINNFSHTYPDDLGIVLVGPTGAALLLQSGCGGDPDMDGVTYSFSDAGSAQLPDLAAWITGTYKPTTYYTGDNFPAPGPLAVYGNPGPAGSGTATFASVFGGTNPNGVWNLFVRDFVTGDAGTIAGGWTLEINPGVVNQQHVVDFDGNGRTDFAVIRNVGGGPNGQVRWFVNLMGPGTTYAIDWGISTDYWVPGDYDGDHKTDFAIWRPGAPDVAAFYILHSQTYTVRIERFGMTGDDPTVIGDYDGDGKCDVAVYRGGALSGDKSTWYYRGSLNNPGGNITYVPWGMNGDFPAPGDYDGDGKNDFVIQRNTGGGQARFWMLYANNVVDYSKVFGTPTDVIVPGDYDGDGKTDIATVRGVGGALQWQYLSSQNSTINYITFGVSATDFPTQGDYDGDGRTDAAIWRPSASAGGSAFWVLGTTSGAFANSFGQNGDYPIANYNHH